MGEQLRREIMGDAYVDRVMSVTTPFTAPLQELITTPRLGRGVEPARVWTGAAAAW